MKYIKVIILITLFFTTIVAKENISLATILKKLETTTLSEEKVKKKGSCRYWYTLSKNAYSELFNYDIHNKNGIFYKLQDATLKIHTKALEACQKEKNHLYSYLHDTGGSACGRCLFRKDIEVLPTYIKNSEERKKSEKQKEEKLKENSNKFIKKLASNKFLIKKLKEIDQKTLNDYDVKKRKGTCTYWYRFTRNMYTNLFHYDIHKKNGIFYKLKNITLKLHDKATQVCEIENPHLYSYLDGTSSCGNCLSRYDIEYVDTLISKQEEVEKRQKEEAKKEKQKEKKLEEDANNFLKQLSK